MLQDRFVRRESGWRETAHAAGRWLAFSLFLNLAWEMTQAPLYVFTAGSDARAIAYSLLHCTAGDGVIALACFLVAAIVARDALWPVHHPWLGGSTAVVAGLAWTAISEWRNVYVGGAWGYAPQMPLLLGIGVAPLLQWLILPVVTLLLMRRRRPPTPTSL